MLFHLFPFSSDFGGRLVLHPVNKTSDLLYPSTIFFIKKKKLINVYENSMLSRQLLGPN
jgi:hypothetical protein